MQVELRALWVRISSIHVLRHYVSQLGVTNAAVNLCRALRQTVVQALGGLLTPPWYGWRPHPLWPAAAHAGLYVFNCGTQQAGPKQHTYILVLVQQVP